MKELQTILHRAYKYFQEGKHCVLATIVNIEGSGYRRKGTRMLISQDGKFTGAISGGCVEKEVWLQSKSVFETKIPKLMTYDGRYRLGCEGTLFILIEPLEITERIIEVFQDYYENRKPLLLKTYYISLYQQGQSSGTYLANDQKHISLYQRETKNMNEDLQCFQQIIKPVKSLFLFGSEHDSVALCKIASQVGWDVSIVAHPLNEKQIDYFKGAKNLIHLLPEEIQQLELDEHSACILMSHSFSRDLAYLLELVNFNLRYIGLLGPHKRRNQLLDELIENNPEISVRVLENLYGPVGLDIGAETPEEIAISILSELQSVFTNTEVKHLKNKSGHIHVRK